jgi:hypothetical protein
MLRPVVSKTGEKRKFLNEDESLETTTFTALPLHKRNNDKKKLLAPQKENKKPATEEEENSIGSPEETESFLIHQNLSVQNESKKPKEASLFVNPSHLFKKSHPEQDDSMKENSFSSSPFYSYSMKHFHPYQEGRSNVELALASLHNKNSSFSPTIPNHNNSNNNNNNSSGNELKKQRKIRSIIRSDYITPDSSLPCDPPETVGKYATRLVLQLHFERTKKKDKP